MGFTMGGGPAYLDQIFPYICFIYGAVMSFALNLPVLERIADQTFSPQTVLNWRSHRGLAYFSLLIGAGWILQNLWFT